MRFFDESKGETSIVEFYYFLGEAKAIDFSQQNKDRSHHKRTIYPNGGFSYGNFLIEFARTKVVSCQIAVGLRRNHHIPNAEY